MSHKINDLIDVNDDINQLIDDINAKNSRKKIEIRQFNDGEIESYVNLIQEAFKTVANDLGMTAESFPASGAYINKQDLYKLIANQGRLFGLYVLGQVDSLVATIGISSKDNASFKIEKLSVLPNYRHLGYGAFLMSFVESYVKTMGGHKVKLGVVVENDMLLKWYKGLGYCTKKIRPYKRTSFTIAFMEKTIVTEKLTSNTLIWLLTHEREKGRPTNTGRLIKDVLPSHTKIVYWSRVAANDLLLKILSDDAYEPILVFPVEGAEERQVSIDNIKRSNNKTKVLIILDGIWKESKKMLRQSQYLLNLPYISLEDLEKTRYTLRRNKVVDHICTVEIAIELLKLMDEEDAVQGLDKAFSSFLENYK